MRTYDTQLYTSFNSKEPFTSLTKLNNCISDIRVWMIQNKLIINDSKTEFIIIILISTIENRFERCDDQCRG